MFSKALKAKMEEQVAKQQKVLSTFKKEHSEAEVGSIKVG
jgi:hypothetical protein